MHNLGLRIRVQGAFGIARTHRAFNALTDTAGMISLRFSLTGTAKTLRAGLAVIVFAVRGMIDLGFGIAVQKSLRFLVRFIRSRKKRIEQRISLRRTVQTARRRDCAELKQSKGQEKQKCFFQHVHDPQ